MWVNHKFILQLLLIQFWIDYQSKNHWDNQACKDNRVVLDKFNLYSSTVLYISLQLFIIRQLK
jgi:hypothetical protein